MHNIFFTKFPELSHIIHNSSIQELFKIDIGVEGHMLFIAIDVPREASERYLSTIEKIMENYSVLKIFKAYTVSEAQQIINMRKAFFPSAIASASKDLGVGEEPLVIGEDICVPISNIVKAVEKIRALAKENNLPLLIGGHVGDGNIHPVTWVKASDEEGKRKFWKFISDIMKIAIELGGTVSAEHGIGTLKKEGLAMELERLGSLKALEIMRGIKKVFDPKNILNPGKIV